MPSNKAWLKGKKIPFTPRCFEYFLGINPEPVEYQSQLVNQRDVDAAIDVLEELRALGDLGARDLDHLGDALAKLSKDE